MKITLEQFTQLTSKVRQFLSESDREKFLQELETLQQESNQEDFWNKPDAQKKMQQVSFLQGKLSAFELIETLANDIEAYMGLDAADQEAFIVETEEKYWKLSKVFFCQAPKLKF